jgi:hypothetical protein
MPPLAATKPAAWWQLIATVDGRGWATALVTCRETKAANANLFIDTSGVPNTYSRFLPGLAFAKRPRHCDPQTSRFGGKILTREPRCPGLVWRTRRGARVLPLGASLVCGLCDRPLVGWCCSSSLGLLLLGLFRLPVPALFALRHSITLPSKCERGPLAAERQCRGSDQCSYESELPAQQLSGRLDLAEAPASDLLGDW